MSLIGPVSLANQTQFPVANRTFPQKGGPRCLPVQLSFTGALTSLSVDLTQQVQSGVLDSVQNVYVDNSLNSAQLIIVTGVPGQRLVVPANSCAYISVLASNPPTFIFSSTGAITVQVIFLNIDMGNHVWSANNSAGGTQIVSDPVLDATVVGNNVTIRQALSAWLDHSVVGSVANASTQLVGANATRRAITIMASKNGQGLWLNLTGGVAAVNGTGCIYLNPGQIYEPENGMMSNAITYFDPVGGLNIAVLEG